MEDLIIEIYLLAIFVIFIAVLMYYAVKIGKKNQSKRKSDGNFGSLTGALGKNIVEVKPLGAGSTDFGSVGGALLGCMLAGPIGAVIGGTHGGKGKQKQRFAIKYDDGSVKVKEVTPGNMEYHLLMKYVKWEDIK